MYRITEKQKLQTSVGSKKKKKKNEPTGHLKQLNRIHRPNRHNRP